MTPAVTRNISVIAVSRNQPVIRPTRHAANLAARRAATARSHREARVAILPAKRSRAQSTREAQDRLGIIRTRFSRIRSPRQPSATISAPIHSAKGVQEFNPMVDIPEASFFKNTVLTQER